MKKAMKIWMLLLLWAGCMATAHAQVPNQDCVGAVAICDTFFTRIDPVYGVGNINDLANSTSCLITGETNSAWYKIKFSSAGVFMFSITPIGPNEDYDFAVFEMVKRGAGNSVIATYTCADLQNDLPFVERCNYAVTPMATGLSATGTENSAGPTGDAFLRPINVDSGDVYYILINNFNRGDMGYSFDISGTTATLANSDTLYPISSSGATGANTLTITLNLNRTFDCNSLSPDFSETVVVDNTGDTLPVLSYTCAADVLLIHLARPAHTVTSATVTFNSGTDGNTLLWSNNCGQIALTETTVSTNILNGVGVQTLKPVDVFSIYPNPTDGQITILLPWGAQSITLTDLSGKSVAYTGAVAFGGEVTLQTNALPTGLYLVQVVHEQGTAVQKLLVID